MTRKKSKKIARKAFRRGSRQVKKASKKIKKALRRGSAQAKKVKFDDVEKVLLRYTRLAEAGIREAEAIRKDVRKHWGKISREINK